MIASPIKEPQPLSLSNWESIVNDCEDAELKGDLTSLPLQVAAFLVGEQYALARLLWRRHPSLEAWKKIGTAMITGHPEQVWESLDQQPPHLSQPVAESYRRRLLRPYRNEPPPDSFVTLLRLRSRDELLQYQSPPEGPTAAQVARYVQPAPKKRGMPKAMPTSAEDVASSGNTAVPRR